MSATSAPGTPRSSVAERRRRLVRSAGAMTLRQGTPVLGTALRG